ncbi:hypothetical protein HHX47_DHR6000435 [Lentinula edodes]|nr:hypothetical protein HHX47_DHR6000435 [Lentinula edodes]
MLNLISTVLRRNTKISRLTSIIRETYFSSTCNASFMDRKLPVEAESLSGPSSKRPRLDLEGEGNTHIPKEFKTDLSPTGTANVAEQPLDHDTSCDSPNKPKKSKDKNLRGRRRRDQASRDEWQARNPDASKEPRLPKRECALMIGFCGSKYSGMQLCVALNLWGSHLNLLCSQKTQPGLPEQRTIEGELFKALVTAGAVSKDNSEDPVKVGLARAARTDAGVHAVGNIVSLKMIMSVPGVDNLCARINTLLPPDIRLWGFPGSHLDRVLRKHATSQGCEIPWNNDPFWSTIDPSTSTWQEDMIRKRAWRATPAHLERLRTIIQKFEKTHNFHNFTVAQDPRDKTNNRFMKKLQVAEPAVYGETEWIAVSLDGQSFMLHQLFELTRVHIPKMPALGLLLEYPVFTGYNTRIAKKLAPSDPDYREPIDFENYSEEMNSFKQQYIYDNMRSIEDRKGLFDGWIRSIDSYKGNDFLYLNPKGIIPPEAIIKKGERRQDPFRERKVFNLTSFAEDDSEKVQVEELTDEANEDAEESLTKQQLEEAEG